MAGMKLREEGVEQDGEGLYTVRCGWVGGGVVGC